MKKLIALLIAGGLAIGTLTAAELTATEKGKEIIAKLEDGKIKNLGQQISETTVQFNDRVKGVLFKKEEKTENQDEPKLDDIPDGGDKDSVIVETSVGSLKLSKIDYDLYEKLTQQIENESNFNDEYKEIIKSYVAVSLASKKGKSESIIFFKNKDDEKKRALSDVYKELRKRMKEKSKEYNDFNCEKEMKDFGNSADFVKYIQDGIGMGEAQAIDWDNADWGEDDIDNSEENAKNAKEIAELDRKNAELDKILADAKAETQRIFDKGNALDSEILKALKELVKAGGNPADFDWYEDWAKKNNIKPEDLVD